jgi:CDGSH-type Zn-finger protein/uncharacterized Fe-S cluster protein YjdI
VALRDAGPFPHGVAARRFIIERCGQLAATAARLARAGSDERLQDAAAQLGALARRATRDFDPLASPGGSAAAAPQVPAAAAAAQAGGAVETIRGTGLDLVYEGKRCIHSRFCVTLAPQVFLANVQGPWIHPDAMPVERLVEIAHACPSGAIRYQRRDGGTQEGAPPVNLAGLREGGPYAFRGALVIDGVPGPVRATLCRCGASRNKPYCDGSHHAAGFSATGEPPSAATEMLPVRDGTLAIDPQPNGPLAVRGNLEITSGTGRVVARMTQAVLCRCGGSANKPFCDGTHARIGFRSS